ncbi:MAG: hypothetical protein KGQ47_03125 [Hyphomicrobiales bacterium]|nr:hypothetical protein [Hyphomicrobiales bacterium]
MAINLSRTLAVLLTAAALAAVAPARGAESVTADDTAKFLAGMPPAADSPLAALTRDPAWQQHAHALDSIFAREDKRTLSKVRAFSRQYLTDKHDTMLYMFSGPDFLYATSFFPSASTYVLAGLEPVGDVPQLTSLPRGVIYSSLYSLERSMGTLLNYSFFITKNMKTQLHEGPVNGTLPILFVFLERTGKTIHEVTYVGLDKEGNVQTPNANDKTGRHLPPTGAPGVKIVFSDGSGPDQTLYYFGTNIADGSIEHSGFLAFCKKLGPADSFIKSASYLLHTGGFNTVRRMLLEQSATILQDDSGIPLAYFDQRQWRLQPFGRYVGPLRIFGNSYQPRMTELFANGHAIPIDFGIGYRWQQNESNLLLAQRTAAATSDNELAPPLPAPHKVRGSQPRKKGRSAAGRSQTNRNGADTDTTGSLGCRIASIFSFCSDGPAKPDR